MSEKKNLGDSLTGGKGEKSGKGGWEDALKGEGANPTADALSGALGGAAKTDKPKKGGLAAAMIGSKQAMEARQARKEKTKAIAADMLAKMAAAKEAAKDAKPLDEVQAAEFESTKSALRRRYDSLIRAVRLTSVQNDLARLSQVTAALPQKVQALRDRGYAYRAYFENKVQVLQEQWDAVDEELKAYQDEEAATLEEALQPISDLFADLAAHGATQGGQALLAQIEQLVNELETRVDAANDEVEGMYNALRREIDQMERQIKEVEKWLELAEEAEISFAPNESLYMAAKAEWDDGADKPEGFLFLTDQRLIFQQNEKVGGRFGFGGKRVAEVLWEIPVTSVEAIEAEKKGLLGGKDMLNMQLGSGAPFAALTVEVKGSEDCREWARHIRRMASGETDERAIEPSAEMLEQLRNAPTDCLVCGAVLPQIQAGQTEVTCRYCGSVVRL